MRHFNLKSSVTAALLGAIGMANAADTPLLPIESGAYVISNYTPCEQVALAGVVTYDGKTLLGPHESDCTSSVLSHHGDTYEVATECRAHGDGTPAKPATVIRRVRIASPTHFSLLGHGNPSDYALCPNFH